MVTIAVSGPSCRWISEEGDEARVEDIERLLQDVATHINRELREAIDWTIRVSPSRSLEDMPVTIMDKGGFSWRETNDGRRESAISLPARGRPWDKFAYQFSHEFCHVIHHRDNPFLDEFWVTETICEVASLFTVRRMAARWKCEPPYPNWRSYSSSLQCYADRTMEDIVRLPQGTSLAAWLKQEEESLRKDAISGDQRQKERTIAVLILPIFESNPTGWNAVYQLPSRNVSIGDYLREWRSRVHQDDREVVDKISKVLSASW